MQQLYKAWKQALSELILPNSGFVLTPAGGLHLDGCAKGSAGKVISSWDDLKDYILCSCTEDSIKEAQLSAKRLQRIDKFLHDASERDTAKHTDTANRLYGSALYLCTTQTEYTTIKSRARDADLQLTLTNTFKALQDALSVRAREVYEGNGRIEEWQGDDLVYFLRDKLHFVSTTDEFHQASYMGAKLRGLVSTRKTTELYRTPAWVAVHIFRAKAEDLYFKTGKNPNWDTVLTLVSDGIAFKEAVKTAKAL